MENTNLERQINEKEVIVISGSSGLIGTALIHKIAPQYRVVGFDKAGNPFPPIEAETEHLTSI